MNDTGKKHMGAICRVVLIATFIFALITILASALAYYYVSNFNVDNLDHAVAVAKDPSTSIQLHREIVEQLGQIALGLLQAAKGALILAIGIGFISTGTFLLIYFKLRATVSHAEKE